MPPINQRPILSLKENTISYSEIFNNLLDLTLCVYTPSSYIYPSKIDEYEERYGRDVSKGVFFKQSDREQGVRRLMSINLMKRMESSIYSFNQTLSRIIYRIDKTIDVDSLFSDGGTSALENEISGLNDFELICFLVVEGENNA